MRLTSKSARMMLALALLTTLSLYSFIASVPPSSASSTLPQLTPPATVTATPPPACGLFWRLVPSPNPGSYDISYGVAAITTNDVWAVGFYASSNGGQTLIMHWDGSIWSLVPSPNPGSSNNFLARVAALTASDVWAVGDYASGSLLQTLIVHWNSSSWSVVPSPNQGSGNNHLSGVVAVAPNDVWAVGDYTSGSIAQTLTEHWNGSSWSIVPSPNQGAGNNYLYEVKAVATNDIWAVGSTVTQTLTEHWNGSSWSIVPSPNVGSSANILQAVTVVATNDVWAVGDYANSNSGPMQTLVEHWNGSAWSVIPSPNGPAGDSVLHGVAAAAANDIWANGYSGATPAVWVPFSEHWDGTAWSIVPIPDGLVAHNSTSWGTAAVAVNDIWTVGDDSHTMTQHYSDPCVTATLTATSTSTPSNTPVPPTSTPTNTPTNISTPLPTNTPSRSTNTPTNAPVPSNTPSNTPAPPTQTPGGATTTSIPTNTATSTPAPVTNTPMATSTSVPDTDTPGGPTSTPVALTSTPTDCPNPFVDITGNVFYAAIHYLNCRGVVNGTDATHYSPAGTSTRGQFAKVVVLGFGTPFYTPVVQDFVDVPPSYFAYLYIESGFHAGILSGFDQASCQAAGQPYPCYLPNRPITRGQLTKLVVNAGGYTLITPTGGHQDFIDVPPSNVFYVSIETAYHNGIVHGYPGGLFLPNNNIRRDEMAQIVYTGIINRP